MNLLEFLDEKLIDLNVKYASKNEVINNIVSQMYDNGYISSIDDFLKDVYYRESLGLTGIGNFIAIPHGKGKSVIKPCIGMVKLQKEIEWETLDDNGVKFIFLFAVPEDKENDQIHLKMLSTVARRLGNDEAVEKLLNANNYNEIKQILR